jgi:hypothetical protein
MKKGHVIIGRKYLPCVAIAVIIILSSCTGSALEDCLARVAKGVAQCKKDAENLPTMQQVVAEQARCETEGIRLSQACYDE